MSSMLHNEEIMLHQDTFGDLRKLFWKSVDELDYNDPFSLYGSNLKHIYNVKEFEVEEYLEKYCKGSKEILKEKINDFYMINDQVKEFDKLYKIAELVEDIAKILRTKHRKYKDPTKKNIEGHVFELQLHKNFNITLKGGNRAESQRRIFAEGIIKKIMPSGYTRLPYFYFIRKRGNYYYLKLIYVDREYYPEGKTIEKIAKQDLYKDAKTGRTISAEDEGAVLVFKKGDVTGETKQFMSDKERSWTLSNAALKFKTAAVKEAITQYLKKKIGIIKSGFYKIKLIQNTRYTTDMRALDPVKVFKYDRQFWWQYRKNMAINRYIRAINQKEWDDPGSIDLVGMQKNIYKLKFWKIKNVKAFEKYILKQILSL